MIAPLYIYRVWTYENSICHPLKSLPLYIAFSEKVLKILSKFSKIYNVIKNRNFLRDDLRAMNAQLYIYRVWTYEKYICDLLRSLPLYIASSKKASKNISKFSKIIPLYKKSKFSKG